MAGFTWTGMSGTYRRLTCLCSDDRRMCDVRVAVRTPWHEANEGDVPLAQSQSYRSGHARMSVFRTQSSHMWIAVTGPFHPGLLATHCA
ncbi:hypothetical protein COMA2_20260 [Candidatus Nitrospira nitrificans]|uniref:Uncharacterized protein n=1 Tax=Candidatus Nitrospira nitrificans TaxID=1742973 RepID=A0A0S4LDW2_9BACT|nr:hypothetical protein COMA2_20260 [Candidatus Nitrospira nitrificans]